MTDSAAPQPYAEVIGDPIAHSKSPLIHNYWLNALGIDAEYRAHHVRPDELERYFAQRKQDSLWRGCNITIPHKVEALKYVADPGGVEATIGAVNCVARDDQGKFFATNTDAAGFYAPIADADLNGKHAVVIGSGGAARAVLFGLGKMGIGSVSMVARSPLKAMALLQKLGLSGEVIGFDAVLPPADILVNTSPLGMTGQPPLEIDLDVLPDHAIVYDIVYAPLETALLSQARERSLQTVDGLDMLIGQAALGFELFFGQQPPDNFDELRRMLAS